MEATDYILAGSPESERAVAQNAAMQLELKSIKLSHIVLSMKDYLIGNDLVVQAKAIEYLVAILEKLDTSFLSRQDVSLMVTYFTARVETAHVAGVKETALGLRALAAMSHFDTADTIEVCRKMFSSGPYFNENSALARFEIYKLIDLYLNGHRDTLEEMEGEFTNGILSLAELEKDPRCLMVYFSILSVILAEWNIQDEVKDLWDSVSRYYPITFRAKPDDPISITPSELKLRLRMCIAATSEFAPMAFPFLIEKLDFQVTANVKKDVLETLSACVQNYDLQRVTTWSFQLWDALKFEVLNATEPELADEALNTLQAMAERLSYDDLTLQTLEHTPLFRFVYFVAKECVKYLREPQQRHAKQSGRIIGKVASGSPFAFHLIIKSVFPELMVLIQDTDTITKKRELLEVVNMVLDARYELFRIQETSEFPAIGILDAVSESCAVGTIAHGGLTFFRDILFETFALCLTRSTQQETAIRITSIRGLLKLIKLPSFLAPTEVGMVIQHLDELVLNEDEDEVGNDLRNEAILALQQIARKHKQQIIDISFSALLAALPRTLTHDGDVKTCLPILESLARIGAEGFLFTILSLRLRDKLEDVLRRSVSQVYAQAILAGLLYAVCQREAAKSNGTANTNGEVDHAKGPDSAYITLVTHLYQFVTCLSFSREGRKQQEPYNGLQPIDMASGFFFPGDIFLDLVGKIGMTAVRSMTVENQAWAANQAFALFKNPYPDEIELAFVTQIQNRSLTLTMHLIAGLHREVDLGFNIQEACCNLIRNVADYGELIRGAQESVLGLIALLFNKWVVASTSTAVVGAKPEPQELVLDVLRTLDSRNNVQATNILRMSVTFTMASNLKGARGTPELLCALVKLLSNQKYGLMVAGEFKLILAPSELLSKENFAVMRGPYKQRPYAICVPQIVDLFKKSDDPKIKSNYLVALSGILKHTPKEVVLPEIESLIPILLQSIETSDSDVKKASIDVLRVAIAESPSSVEGHLRSIVNRLYDRVRNTQENPANGPSSVRVKALKCLGAIPRHLSSAIALRYKTEVLRELEHALDDVKRNVREEAVRCRFLWFNLAENAEDSD